MRDYDFIAVPVVDYQNHLLGIITIDDILMLWMKKQVKTTHD